MQYYLKHTWNTGVAIGELISSLMFSFLLFTIVAIVKRNYEGKIRLLILPMLFSIIGFVAVFSGWAVGNNISMGSGKSFLTPVSAISLSIYHSAYKALPMILGFQIIGTLIGTGLYMGVIYVLKSANQEYEYKDAFTIDKLPIKSFVIKELIAQLIFVGSIIFINSWAPVGQTNITESDKIIEMAVMLIALGIISLIFSPLYNFFFSPWITIVSWLFIKPTKEQIIKMSIALVIQIGLVIGIAFFHQYLGKLNRAI